MGHCVDVPVDHLITRGTRFGQKYLSSLRPVLVAYVS